MTQQESDLLIRQREYRLRKSLFMRALTEQAQILEPCTDACGRPSVAIPTDDELMPQAASGMTRDTTTELLRGFANGCAVFFGGRRVTQRLMLQIAAVTDQLTEQDQPMIRPALRL